MQTRLHHIFSKTPDTLVIGPGGVKGAAKLGVLLFLEELGKLEPKTIIGCSIGSIIGLLLSVGYKASELLPIMYKCKHILDNSKVTVSMNPKYLIDIGELKRYISSLVRYKLGYLPTLGSLYSATNIHYISVTYRPIQGDTLYLDYRNYPDMCVVEAAFHSARIPVIFSEGMIDGHVVEDGASGDPLPIKYVDRKNNYILSILALEQGIVYDTVMNKIKTFVDRLIMPLMEKSYREAGDNVDHVIVSCDNVGFINPLDSLTGGDSVYHLNNIVLQGYNHIRQKYYDVAGPPRPIITPRIDFKSAFLNYVDQMSEKKLARLLTMLVHLEAQPTSDPDGE